MVRPSELVPAIRIISRGGHAPHGGELPVAALIRNVHGVAEWKLFLNE